MNHPASMMRLLGTERVSAALYVGWAVAVLGWFSGAVPWWLGLMALCFVGTVRKAVKDVRRYDQWAAQWQAMGGGVARSPRPARAKPVRGKASSRWTGAIAAALLLFIIPVIIATPGASEAARSALTLLWLATAVYLLCKLVIKARPARAQNRAGTVRAGASKNNATAADVVEWVLPRASSSPSRADAARRLPGYSARLLQ